MRRDEGLTLRDVRTGDELQDLAEQFNNMATRLRESYAGLERKVEDRTAELAQRASGEPLNPAILVEVDRDHPLVDDLLALARAEEGLGGEDDDTSDATDAVTLVREAWDVPAEVGFGDATLVPLRAAVDAAERGQDVILLALSQMQDRVCVSSCERNGCCNLLCQQPRTRHLLIRPNTAKCKPSW